MWQLAGRLGNLGGNTSTAPKFSSFGSKEVAEPIKTPRKSSSSRRHQHRPTNFVCLKVPILEWIDGFRVPFRVDYVPESPLQFVPRDQELQQMERCLLPNKQMPAKQSRFVLHGTGGMGKTRISVHFAYLHQHDFDSIFFLDGTSLSTIKDSFATILSRVTKQAGGDLTEAIVASGDSEAAHRALKWFCFEGNQKWLLIFDNVDSQALGEEFKEENSYSISDWFPSVSWGSVLITTRLTDLSRLGRETRVQKMDLVQSRKLCANVLLHVPADLLELLDGLPLAIQQAGAYIVKTGTTIASFVAEYQISKQRLLNDLPHVNDDEHGSIRTTWTMSFKRIKELGQPRAGHDYTRYEHATNLLSLWAFLDQQGVSFELLSGCAQGPGVPGWFSAMTASKSDFLAAISVLRSFSLVEFTEGEDSYSMHRILHDWCTSSLPGDEKESMEFLALAVRVVGYFAPTWLDPNGEEVQRRLLAHADAMYDRLKASLPSSPDYPHALRAWNILAIIYAETGRTEEAIDILKELVTTCSKALGPQHPRTLMSVEDLGVSFMDEERYDEAIAAFQDSLERRKNAKALGPDHPRTIQAMRNLARAYQKNNDWLEAADLLHLAANMCERRYGTRHLETIITQDRLLLRAFSEKNGFEKSEQWYKRAVAQFDHVLGKDHETSATKVRLAAIGGLALTAEEEGRLGEAEKYISEAVTGFNDQFGPEDKQCVIALGNWARISASLGNFATTRQII
ncbi:P-loop containing nucleoside triphosphate hydrolase protein, partial [Cladorrhinum samala]